jgi:hypothetical protein
MVALLKRSDQMNQMEKASLNHATEWLRYQKSPKARNDLAADIARRNRLTISQGHSLKCGILKCHPECPTWGGK